MRRPGKRLLLVGAAALSVAACTGTMAQEAPGRPPEDLTAVTEIERLREYAVELQKDRQGKDSDIATYRAYIRKLEARIRELELRVGLEGRVTQPPVQPQ